MSGGPPLFAVSGASGVGKTTATEGLPALVSECIRLDADLLWRHEYYNSPEETSRFYETWLRLVVALLRQHRPVIYSGAILPGRWEALPLGADVSSIHYLALVCEPEEHAARLRGRGNVSMDAEYIPPSLDFNVWLRANAAAISPPMDVLDTTGQSPDETTEAVASWVRARLEASS